MVKSYLRHGPTEAFGLICSPGANSIYDGKLAYVPALEDVLVWDIKKGQMLNMWHDPGHRAQVTCIARSPKSNIFAIGYADGSIRLWDAATNTVAVRFNGHRKAVTALAFDGPGLRLASGGQDTDLIVWDVVAAEGIKRLTGHRDQITAITFIDPQSDNGPASFILTASKDTLLKVWSLSTWHCVETVVGHHSEIWAFALDPSKEYLLTGSSEGEVKSWTIDNTVLYEGKLDEESGERVKAIRHFGLLSLASSQRVSQILYHPHQPFLGIQTHDRTVEIFRIRSEEELRNKNLRRKKRAKEKVKNTVVENEEAGGDNVNDNSHTLMDLLAPYLVVRASGKIRSFSFPLSLDPKTSVASKNIQLFAALATNSIEVHAIPIPSKTRDKSVVPESSRLFSLDLPGHRTDIRALSLSSDDSILASASNGQVKIWNMKTFMCIRTIECGYSVCCTFLPGDRLLSVGTKSGEITILDVGSASVVDRIPAHDATIWSLRVRPDGGGLASGSADKNVKFWDIAWSHSTKSGAEQATASGAEHVPKQSVMTLKHSKTLKLGEDVLAVCFSPNGRYIAVALLDSTVKIFYQDTLKFYLSLYGHKLPVLCMDISFDSKLLVTCSADKHVKIWGLDYGDCHRSIFAHDESVMQVAFETRSHYFWSTGKDHLLKYWDGDKFVNIQSLDGHHGEIWALALSSHGKFVVTASHDKSIRIWEKLEEPLFLEEEQERQLEHLYEKDIADDLNHSNRLGYPDESNTSSFIPEASTVKKQTIDTLMAGEKIIEALDIADSERNTFRIYEETRSKLSTEAAEALPEPERNAILTAYNLKPDAYVLLTIQKIPLANLADALSILPFSKVLSLLVYLDEWVQKGLDAVLVSRVLFFLLRIHHHQIAANRVMRTTLIPLRKHLREHLQSQKEILAYNLVALKFVKQSHDALAATGIMEQTAEGTGSSSEKSAMFKRKRVKL